MGVKVPMTEFSHILNYCWGGDNFLGTIQGQDAFLEPTQLFAPALFEGFFKVNKHMA